MSVTQTCGVCGCAPCVCRSRWLRWLWFALVVGWLIWLAKELIRLCRLANRDRGKPADGVVPPWAYRQPDPMIYSQQFLQQQGLAVTWDNPDIHIELATSPGVPVDAHFLHPDTDYLVIARVWNGSTTAPAPGLPVKVSYLEFGVATVRHDVGLTAVDLPVKGAGGCPAFATVPWHTPAAAGHYCLQVELLWDDDAEPGNNLGQSNTDVKALNSPHAAFTFPVRNDRRTQGFCGCEPTVTSSHRWSRAANQTGDAVRTRKERPTEDGCRDTTQRSGLCRRAGV